MSYQAVLFDLDGTLLDTIDDLADSTNRALKRMGLPAHPAESYKYFIGDGVENIARRALGQAGNDADAVAQCIIWMRQEYSKRWAEKTRPYDGVGEMLTALAGRRVAMAILSNKPDEFTRLIVAELLGHWRFEPVRGARDDAPPKPDPAVALEIARSLQVPPAKFLYLGDTNTDMQTANAAGMYAVGATWGFRPAQELLDSGAKTLIDRPCELLSLL